MKFSTLVSATLVLTLVVIMLGAYTRLTDAGLGCPDWPGCYGKLHAPLYEHHISAAQIAYPDADIDPFKARNEMLHRYVAGLLGVAVLSIFITSLLLKRYRRLSALLLGLVIFQAALGMWTVTLNLLPLVVLAHLLGGFSLLSLTALLRAEIYWDSISTTTPQPSRVIAEPALSPLLGLGLFVLVVLILQIALGGWTSSNYAALVCHQLPLCEAGWQERYTLASIFHLPLGHETYEYGVLPYEARMSIHVTHRLGAIFTLLVFGFFLLVSWKKAITPFMRRLILLMGISLLTQVLLGLINIVAVVLLWNAVAHNLVAAGLLMLLAIFLRQLVLRRNHVSVVARAPTPINTQINVIHTPGQ